MRKTLKIYLFFLLFNQKDKLEKKLLDGKTNFIDCFPDYIELSKKKKNFFLQFPELSFIPQELLGLIEEYTFPSYYSIIRWLKQKFRSVAPSNLKLSILVISALNEKDIKKVYEHIEKKLLKYSNSS